MRNPYASVSIPATIVSFLLMGVILIPFNLFPDQLGYFVIENGAVSATAMLAPAFSTYLPWLDVVCILTVILDVILLARRQWTRATRLFDIGLHVCSAALLAWMALGAAPLNAPGMWQSLRWLFVLVAIFTLAAAAIRVRFYRE